MKARGTGVKPRPTRRPEGVLDADRIARGKGELDTEIQERLGPGVSVRLPPAFR